MLQWKQREDQYVGGGVGERRGATQETTAERVEADRKKREKVMEKRIAGRGEQRETVGGEQKHAGVGGEERGGGRTLEEGRVGSPQPDVLKVMCTASCLQGHRHPAQPGDTTAYWAGQ
ncbi:unnamed protein product [Pleuronectes platessa]|uniref:Uncharacterized protein n=1 Tax=Pleuronectes platessa TaxID=8262 RepID=A0A9N7TS72_PLEPL|nr:unnamed protein product [Pleuronectes platessa]